MMTEELKEYLTKKYINSVITQKLYNMLSNIWANDEFVFGIISELKTDEKKLKMIELLEQGLKDTDEINVHSMAISRGIEVDEMKEMIASIDWSKRQIFHREM